MKKSMLLSLILISIVSISGCISALGIGFTAMDDSGVTTEGLNTVKQANNKFAIDYYNKLKSQEDGNIFFSPYSISSALSMTYEGAREQTAEEMADVFYFPEDDDTRRSSYASLYNKINKPNKYFELSTANALWAQEDYSFEQDYFDIIDSYYGGKVTNVDFKTKTEESRQTINTWVEDQTNNKIKDLIPFGILTPETRLVLTNAIYFKGTWEWEFDKSDTREENFKITPENIIKVPMMYMDPEKADINYADTGEVQLLELPYKGDELSMLIILPNQGEEYDFETGEDITYDYTLEDIELTSEKLNEYKDQMHETKLDAIYLPKFEFDTKYFMSKDLKEMGMPTAFTWPGADFSGMDETKMLYITDVIHQAYVKVDEKGTEAAAATAVVMGLGSAAGPSKIFRADHPFIFIIQQRETGNILFMGRVVDPIA